MVVAKYYGIKRRSILVRKGPLGRLQRKLTPTRVGQTWWVVSMFLSGSKDQKAGFDPFLAHFCAHKPILESLDSLELDID